jgi:PAS domain S-box-containing protein
MDRVPSQPGPPSFPDVLGVQVSDLRGRLLRIRSEDSEVVDAEELMADLETAYEELRVADEEVRAQQEQIAQLLEGQTLMRWQQERMMSVLPVATMSTDRHGVIRVANVATAHLLGMRMSRVLGKPAVTLFAAEERPHLRRLLSELAHGREGFHRRTRLVPREGQAIDVEITVARTPGSSPELSWMLLDAGLAQPGEEGAADPLPRSLAELATLPTRADDLQHLLQRAAELATTALGSAMEATVTLGPPDAPDALASSGVHAQLFDGAQIAHGEGPCITAFESLATVHTADAHHDPRWPLLAPDVPAEITSVIASPLESGDRLVGALNVYGLTTAPVTSLIPRVELLAATIAAVVYEFSLKSELKELAADMERALTSRAVIDQAKGIVIAERGCSPDEAFQHLVQLSSTQQLKLREVARLLVERRAGGH